MPTYEYVCKDCNYTFDLFQTMTEEPITVCPECSGTVKRKIGAGAGPIFKGSGFYQTDYKKPSTDDKTKTSKTTESKPESSSQ
ncbi:MAG: zinc ribbon domain-containing protein [Ignavibacteriaceae bacterium]|nr:zinc ribbon domain-containing protein [Ignavibacteriaceae bacterium]